jgi:hypothetical protein
VNDKATEILLRQKERLPYPKEVLRSLVGERPIWVNSGMNEEPQSIIVGEWPICKPMDVLGRNFIGCKNAVADEGGGATVIDPVSGGRRVEERMKEPLLVIAPQEYVVGARTVQVDEVLDGLITVGASVDVVADEDKSVGATGGIGLALGKQLDELAVASVHVPDREGKHEESGLTVARGEAVLHGAQNNPAIDRDGGEDDVDPSPVGMKEAGSNIDPDIFLAVRPLAGSEGFEIGTGLGGGGGHGGECSFQQGQWSG